MEVLYPRCAGLDVHKDTVVAAVRVIEGDGSIRREVETFATTTPGLLASRTGWTGTAALRRHGGDRHLLAPGLAGARGGRPHA